MPERRRKSPVRLYAEAAMRLLASTIFTADRILTPQQKRERRRLMRLAPKVLGRRGE